MLKKLSAFLLSTVLLAGVSSNLLANADGYKRTITLQPNGSGSIYDSNMYVGDTIRLDLVNPTDRTLTFRTTRQIGPEKSFTVAPNSTRRVSFKYRRFADSVDYITLDTHDRYMSPANERALANDDILGDDVYKRTVWLKEGGKGSLDLEQIDIGDEVLLTLKNPSNRPLVFEANALLGINRQYTVQPNDTRMIRFNYTRPSVSVVEYQVERLYQEGKALLN